MHLDNEPFNFAVSGASRPVKKPEGAESERWPEPDIGAALMQGALSADVKKSVEIVGWQHLALRSDVDGDKAVPLSDGDFHLPARGRAASCRNEQIGDRPVQEVWGGECRARWDLVKAGRKSDICGLAPCAGQSANNGVDNADRYEVMCSLVGKIFEVRLMGP